MKYVSLLLLIFTLYGAYFVNQKFVFCINNQKLCEVTSNKFYILLEKEVLMMNSKEKIVMLMSPKKKYKFWDYNLIEKQSKGVLLGDGVKGNAEDSFHFSLNGVTVIRLNQCIFVHDRSKYYESCDNLKSME